MSVPMGNRARGGGPILRERMDNLNAGAEAGVVCWNNLASYVHVHEKRAPPKWLPAQNGFSWEKMGHWTSYLE